MIKHLKRIPRLIFIDTIIHSTEKTIYTDNKHCLLVVNVASYKILTKQVEYNNTVQN